MCPIPSWHHPRDRSKTFLPSYDNQHPRESPAPLSPSTHFSEFEISKQLLGQASPKEQRQPQEHPYGK